MSSLRVALFAANTEKAARCRASIERVLDLVPLERAEYVLALGGDGLMLEVLRRYGVRKKKVYGINCGSVGFLMNAFDEEKAANLLGTLQTASSYRIAPLVLETTQQDGTELCHIAFNDVSLFRRTAQVAKLRLSIDGAVRMPELLCDGINLSTPAGSTAYNLSLQGPVLPLSSNLLALMPIAPFRPRRWRGALLPREAMLEVETLECEKRPISAVADNAEVTDVVRARMHQDKKSAVTVLFDSERDLNERVVKEQFAEEF